MPKAKTIIAFATDDASVVAKMMKNHVKMVCQCVN